MTKKAKNNPNIKHNAETGKYKRPNHPDFWDTTECKKNKLTGVRQNRMAMQWEFWILGNLERTVSFLAVSIDKDALTKAHAEVFHMIPDDPKLFVR